jgi:L-amino acid N-acyltransferase YncA
MSMIRQARESDVGRIVEVYNYYIKSTIITFELEPVAVDEMLHRIEKYSATSPFLVLEEAGNVIGYCYASPFRERDAYENTVETSIYLDKNCTGKGFGRKLYTRLLEDLSARYHVLVGVIALPNDVSVALHESLGFEKAGQLCEVGRKFERWIDVGYWMKRGG